ncbi:hypothetical protein [Endozoicomonas numazuensis]|uniref:Uncharacterized protein n=1 Tax=Endozoicomonas numazuensis TaxID=1137799 RepID=A0A081NMK5_9GAMM|nr:hypothetical protein [Endozoicomonas numazuensis]KEQ19678.1 hypothetical protein GZ78_07290 [Endozoicomonas numazuensis]
MNSSNHFLTLPLVFLIAVTASQSSQADSLLSIPASLMFGSRFLTNFMQEVSNNKVNLTENGYTSTSTPLSHPPACLITARSDALPKAIREANETGYRCTIFFSGEAILSEPLQINNHLLLGIDDTSSGFSATGEVLFLPSYFMVSADENHHFLKPDHKTTLPVTAPLNSAGFPMIRPSKNFQGSSLIEFSGKAALSNIVFVETPGTPIISEVSYVGSNPENLVLTDVLWSISHSTPYSCTGGSKTSSTTSSQDSTSSSNASDRRRSSIASCLRFLFCCGGSGGGDDDENRQWRIEERLRREKNADTTPVHVPVKLSWQESDSSRTSDTSDNRRKFPSLGRRAQSANDLSRRPASTEDLDKQLASIRGELSRMTASRIDLQFQSVMLNQQYRQISQSLITLPQNKPPSRVNLNRLHSMTLGMGDIINEAADETAEETSEL